MYFMLHAQMSNPSWIYCVTDSSLIFGITLWHHSFVCLNSSLTDNIVDILEERDRKCFSFTYK